MSGNNQEATNNDSTSKHKSKYSFNKHRSEAQLPSVVQKDTGNPTANFDTNRIRDIDQVGGLVTKRKIKSSRSEFNLARNANLKSETAFTDSFSDLEEDLESMDSRDLLEPSFKDDKYNIALLFFLYVLQGIPLGLSAAVPMLLQNRGSSYKEQAQFSLVMWPFSLKLLWAPIVDYLYIRKLGRRKSWLIPTQYLLGLFMFYLSTRVDDWLNSTEAPSIRLITFFFFILNFLAATQDIAVDGWALTMLKRYNVGYASTCNSVGQTVGYFLGYVLFMALESADFCNSYLRSVPSKKGIVTLPSYLFMWAIVFIISTTFVAIFKRERQLLQRRSSTASEMFISDDSSNVVSPITIKESYSILMSIIKLKPVFTLAAILLTAKIGFAACDGVSHLKLMEAGIPKEEMAILAVPLVPLQILLPLVISRYTTGRRPMDVYLRAYPYRLLMNVVIGLIVWFTPNFLGVNNSVPYHYYAILVIIYCIEQVTVYSMFVATMAFFARISDPSVGGTYMTLLNTLSNLGSSWTTTAALWLVDTLTYKSCSIDNYSCSSTLASKVCTDRGGKCITRIDGYYVQMFVCTTFGILWYLWANKYILHLQSLGETSWLRRRRTASTFGSRDR